MATRASKKSSLEGGAFDLSDLGLGDGFVTAKDYDAASVDDFIPTGIPALDAALAGGIPMSRITEIFSKENVGKSTFVIQLNRMANEMGIYVVWFDVEGTNNREHLEEMGVDMSKTIMYQPKSDDLEEMAIESMAEQMEKVMLKFHEAGHSVVIVVDSVGQSMGKSTVKGDYDLKQPGIQAKAWSQALYKLQPLATKTNSALLLINQVRDKIGGMPGPFADTVETPGGHVLRHATTFRIRLDKLASKTLAGEDFGHMTQFRLVKSKLSQPRVKVKGIWLFGLYGFHESINLLLDGVEAKIIKPGSGGNKGKYYKVPDPETGEQIEIYEKDLPGLIESGEIKKYTPVFAWLEKELSDLYFPEGHPALKNKNYPLAASELFSKVKVLDKSKKMEEVPEETEKDE